MGMIIVNGPKSGRVFAVVGHCMLHSFGGMDTDGRIREQQCDGSNVAM